MLGGLKDRIIGRKRHDIDFGDVRSHVIGGSQLGGPQTIGDKFGLDRPPAEFPEPFQRSPYGPAPYAQAPYDEPPLQQPQQPRFGSRPDPRMDFGMPEETQPRGNYDILDRLNLIESQLAAIRSQAETINERLKNIDARLAGRRY